VIKCLKDIVDNETEEAAHTGYIEINMVKTLIAKIITKSTYHLSKYSTPNIVGFG
tara:strand:+ start:2176 stop:2340 length:165 start_codon:yes stop_codon:yes gene_type:complete